MGTMALAPGVWMWPREPSMAKTPTSSHEMVRLILSQSRSAMPDQLTTTPFSASAQTLYLYDPNLGTRPLRSSSRWWLCGGGGGGGGRGGRGGGPGAGGRI